jgi:hypothetical protein
MPWLLNGSSGVMTMSSTVREYAPVDEKQHPAVQALMIASQPIASV